MSNELQRALQATSPKRIIPSALEITHPDLAIPVRVTSDSQNVTFEGHTFIPCAYVITKPDDVDQQLPHAELSVDNIGRELTQWLEYSNGGRGAMCRLINGVRSDDGVLIDAESMTLAMSDLAITAQRVTANLTMLSSLSKAAVAVRYDPTTAIGIFD